MVLGAITLTFSNLVFRRSSSRHCRRHYRTRNAWRGLWDSGRPSIWNRWRLGANFIVNYFNLFNSANYGLVGELIVAAIGAVLLVVVTHLFPRRRTVNA